jgi:hypothetical protein
VVPPLTLVKGSKSFAEAFHKTRHCSAVPARLVSSRHGDLRCWIFPSARAMFILVPWWFARLINSIMSFTLIVFTIPLAFDVGGRDCGLVRAPSVPVKSHPGTMLLRVVLWPWLIRLLAVVVVWLMVDVFAGAGDVLFQFIVSETWSAEVSITLAPWSRRLHSKLHYRFDPGDCPQRIHYKLKSLHVDS